jgi:hypothetical protein
MTFTGIGTCGKREEINFLKSHQCTKEKGHSGVCICAFCGKEMRDQESGVRLTETAISVCEGCIYNFIDDDLGVCIVGYLMHKVDCKYKQPCQQTNCLSCPSKFDCQDDQEPEEV